jgi:hypothetical protein
MSSRSKRLGIRKTDITIVAGDRSPETPRDPPRRPHRQRLRGLLGSG